MLRWSLPAVLRILGSLTVACLCSMMVGCNNRSSEPVGKAESSENKPDQGPLRLCVVDDPEFAEAIETQWAARAETPLEVRRITATELLAEKSLNTDVLIYPSRYLGELAERGVIMVLPPEALKERDFEWSDILELVRLRETAWGEKTYAVPLGSAPPVLWYRPDLLRAAGLEVPRTWPEYLEATRRLSDRDALRAASVDATGASDRPWSGTLEPLRKDSAVDLFFAHAAPSVRHRSQYSTFFDFRTMEPLIAGPPFVEALEQLMELAKLSPASTGLGIDQVREAFVRGECAMAIAWPSRAEPQVRDLPQPRQVAFAELPGSDRAYNASDKKWESRRAEESPFVPMLGVAGRMGSITRESPRARSSLNLLRLLASSEWSSEVSPRSRATAPFRQSHRSQAANWIDEGLDGASGDTYFAALQSANTRPQYLLTLRLPGRDEYHAALADSVEAAVRGELAPQAALEQVAARWREITEKHGIEKQRQAYRRSLGLDF